MSDHHECHYPNRWPTDYGRKWQCVCGRRYVVRAGNGMTTPPRLYWKQVRRLHVRRYWA